MTIARNRLEIARSAIRKGEKPGGKEGGNEEEWWYSDGIFVNFASDVLESAYRSKDNDLKRKCSLLHGHLGRIGNHLNALLNICSQANWQKKMVLQHNLDKFHAMEYGSVIADAFITRYRSSYDSIGWAFKELANQPGSISPKFKELRDAYKEDEDEFVKNLGEDLANLIKSCD